MTNITKNIIKIYDSFYIGNFLVSLILKCTVIEIAMSTINYSKLALNS